jgi:pimeloyl-ACP methyl ester carboxylesterase
MRATARFAGPAVDGRIVAVTNRTSSVPGELCRILTDDGLELQGFYVRRSQKPDAGSQKSEVPQSGARPKSPLPSPSCVVHAHGWDGNFYENRFIDHAARACGRVGVDFAAFNNRGHDYIADVLRQRSQQPEGKGQKPKPRLDYVQAGGMFERFEECLPDVKAAVDFAEARGCRKVFLQGHSLGAMKATYYLAKTGDPRIIGLILLSPADTLSWIRQKLGKGHTGALAHAQRLVRQGRGTELMPLRFYESPVSARTFVEAYGPKSLTGIFNVSRTDRQRFPELAAVTVPVLLTVGTVEEYFVGPAQGFVDGIAECLEGCSSFTGIVLEGAPHNYLGYEQDLAGELENWLRQMIRENV